MFSPLTSFFSKRENIYLFFIILFGLIVLTFRLGTVPNGFHWDEAANGYSAFSVMESGRDEWGVRYPLFIQSFGDFKSAFLTYAMIPFFKIGGVNETMARLTGVLLALLGVVGLVKFVSKKSSSLGLLSGVILVTNPWFLHYARIAFEPMPSLGVMLLGLWGWQSKDKNIKVIGAILLLVSMYIYHSARVVVPLLIIMHTLVFHRKKLWQYIRNFRFAWLILFIGTVITGYSVIFTSGGERAKDVFFWDQTQLTTVVEEGIYRNKVLELPLVRVFNNKGWEVLVLLSKKYANHFSPEYLLPQNNQTDAFSFQRQGNFYILLAPFLVLGVFSGYKRDDYYWFFLGWLLVSPIPSSLTSGMINPNRSLIMIPALCYFAARGIMVARTWMVTQSSVKKTGILFNVLIAGLFVVNFSLYFHDWLIYFPEASERYWHGFNRQASQDIWQRRHDYDKVYFTNTDTQPYVFFAWYNQIEPQMVHEQAHNRDLATLEGIRQLDNIYFWPVKSNTTPCYLQEENSLVVISANDADALPAQGFTPDYTYYHQDRFHPEKPALWAYESKNMTASQRKVLAELCKTP